MEWHLAGYDSHPIDGDAASVASLAEHLVALTGDVRSHMDQLRALDSSEIWESTSGSAEDFREVVGDMPQKLEVVATRYEAVAGTLEGFHPVLAGTKQEAEFWIQEAAAAQAEVERAANGVELMVEHERNAQRAADTTNADRAPDAPEAQPEPWQGEDYNATLAAAQADLERAVANVQSAVGQFKDTGDSCAQSILDAADDPLQRDGWFSDIFGLVSGRYGLVPDDQDPPESSIMPSPGTDPATVARWWAALSEETQQRLIRDHYAELGRLRGLPAEDIDRINRLRLDHDIPDLERRLADLDATIRSTEDEIHRTDDWAAKHRLRRLQAERERLATELGNARKIKQQMEDLDRRYSNDPRGTPYLLTYFYQNEGRFAVALGNPDTANNTAVVVPGTGHDVKKEGGLFPPVSEGERLLTEMNAHDPAARNSVIVWMGADMPDHPIDNAPNPTYGDSEHGAGRLRDDVTGYQAAHAQANSGNDGHTTVVAHSYGSYMAGEAVRAGMKVDDFVNIGSAGIKADNAGELGMANEHVWVGEAPGDNVPDVAPPWLGNDPNDPDFGATVFDTSDSSGHSEYYKPDSHSLDNISRIAVGQYDAVERRPAG